MKRITARVRHGRRQQHINLPPSGLGGTGHGEDAALKRSMARAKIEEEQDLISRLIHGADRLTDKQLEALIKHS